MYAVLLPYFSLKIYGPWTIVLAKMGIPLALSIHSIIGYFLTDWLFSSTTFESYSAKSKAN